MATDVERLIVALEARTTAFEKALQRANGSANRQSRSIERRFQQMNRNLTSGFGNLGNSLVKAFAVVGGIRGMQSLLDSTTKIDNALKVAGLSGAELEMVYNRLRDSALKNAAPLETLVTLYGRAALVQKELGVSQEEMLNFTDKIALALRVAGTDAQSASGALLQLSQALGSGVVRAEEFNSILEGALPIAQAAAAGLKEAGGSVAQLRQLVVDGKVSSEAFFRAFEAGSAILEDKVAGATLTTEQGLTNVKTAMIDAMREFAQGSMAAESLGEAFGMMADHINSIDFKQFGEQVRELLGMIEQVRQALSWLQNVGVNLGAAIGTDAIGDWATGGKAYQEYLGGALGITNQRGVQRRIDDAFGEAVAAAGDLTEDAIQRTARRTISTEKGDKPKPKEVTTVSLDDFTTPTKSGGRGTGGRGKRGGRERENELQREIQQINDRTLALQAETAAQASINPLIDDYDYAISKASATQELLNAAKKAGIEITPALQEKIAGLAEAYAQATVASSQLAESQEQAREASEFFKGSMMDAFQSMIPAIETGNKALDGFLNTLMDAVNQALLLGKGPLAGLFGGGTGLLGTIFGFAKGGVAAHGRPQPMQTFARGGVSRTAAIFGEAGPEAAVPLPDGRRIPVDLNMPKNAGSGSQNVHVTVGVSTDGNGNLMPFVESVARNEAAQATAGLSKRVPTMVDNRSNARQVRGTRG